MKRFAVTTSFGLLLALLLLVSCAPSVQEERREVSAPMPPLLERTVPLADGEPREIIITANGFEPTEITIKAGQTVRWVNKDSQEHWPASAVHPTHTAYPGSGLSKCGTDEEKSIFDACGPLATGEKFSFTFTEKGSWAYHDHLQPGNRGKVVVE